MGEGTELSSSSRRLSTLGLTSSIPRAAPPRLGFSSTGGATFPALETPFSWMWWTMLLEGSGGAVSSVTENDPKVISFTILIVYHFVKHSKGPQTDTSYESFGVPAEKHPISETERSLCTFCGEDRRAVLDSIELQQQAVQLRQVAAQG